MTEADAIKALDEGFADGLKKLFGVFVQGLDSDPAGVAEARFTKGLAYHLEAHKRSLAIIKQHFGS